MVQAQPFAETSKTKLLLSKLNLAIDEARSVKKILALNDELRIIENMPDKILKVRHLRKELADLEDHLAKVRDQSLEFC